VVPSASADFGASPVADRGAVMLRFLDRRSLSFARPKMAAVSAFLDGLLGNGAPSS